MKIDRYELGSIAFIAHSGPLWNTTGPEGQAALLQIRSVAESSELQERWKAWARVDDPHVAALIDAVRHEDGRIALVTEMIEGPSLENLIGTPHLRDRAQRAAVVAGVREGLAALHSVGVVHGDISPSNVLIHPTRGAVLIDVADEVGEGGGTPGWSGECGGGIEGDLEALELLAEELGVCANEGADEDSRALGAVERERLGDLRIAAQSLPTEEPTPAGDRRRAPGPKPRSLIASAVLAVLLIGAAAMAMSRIMPPTPQAEVAGSGVVVGAACPSGPELVERVEEILRTRDAALRSVDAAGLDAVLDGPLLDADTALVESMSAGDVEVHSFMTHVEDIGRGWCDDSGLHVELVARQGAYQRCDAGECRNVPEQESHQFILHLKGDPLRAVAVTAPQAGADQ